MYKLEHMNLILNNALHSLLLGWSQGKMSCSISKKKHVEQNVGEHSQHKDYVEGHQDDNDVFGGEAQHKLSPG